MSDPFLAEIRIFAGNFAPYQWATCDGQLLKVSQNTALFSLIGTYYGGDGVSTFQLPNLAGSAAVAAGNGNGLTPRALGESGGEPSVSLLTSELPLHNHPLMAHAMAGSTGVNTAAGNALTQSESPMNLYQPTGTPIAMSPQAISPIGGSLPHNNLQPYMMLTFIIALRGIFPQRP